MSLVTHIWIGFGLSFLMGIFVTLFVQSALQWLGTKFFVGRYL